MKRALSALLLCAALAGCANQSAPPDEAQAPDSAQPASAPAPADEVVATVRGDEITMHQLQEPLVEAYGLNMLLELVQLDLAEQQAQQQNVTVTQEDVDHETTLTLIAFRRASKQDLSPSTDPANAADAPEDAMTPLEQDRLLGLLLSTQRLTRVEFDLAMRTNAILRKLVSPAAQTLMTEENVRNHFNAIYGEKARVRFIRMSDMLGVSKVEGELKSGSTFEEEERLHAYDLVGRPASGDLPPFSRQDPYYPAEFKMVAFGLKPGQISDPVQIKDDIYLLQLVELIPPQHASFDDYKDAVRTDLFNEEVQARVKAYLQDIRAVARQTLEIKNPVLRKQWDQNLRNADELREQLHKQQEAETTRPSEDASPAAPATMPGF